MAHLQVALDVTELKRAVEIASQAVEGGADWVEVGTPLIKSAGMDAVRTLRKSFPDATLVADMKVMDVGATEVEIAAKAGADVVCVLAVASDVTIRDAMRSANRYGVRICADLIGVADPVARIKELSSMGVPIVCLHTGIDDQMAGEDVLSCFEGIEEARKASDILLAVAGGLDEERAAYAVEYGADIVIVGSAITRSPDPRVVAEKIRHTIDDVVVGTSQNAHDIARSTSQLRHEKIIEMLMKVSTPNLSDAMHRKPSLDVKSIFPCKIAGKVITVSTCGGDWAKSVEAIDLASPGDIIVVDSRDDVAVWGGLASLSAKQKGLGGAVIYGAVRDVDEIRRVEFPVFFTNVVSNAGDPKGFGEIGVELSIRGTTIRSGDYLLADENGCMIIPKEDAYEAAKRALEVTRLEERLRAEIEQGSTLSKVSELLKWEKKR
ncbi:MAG: 3-hexulose-6-phosphate synthase [Methermicoccaceae archaeon]